MLEWMTDLTNDRCIQAEGKEKKRMRSERDRPTSRLLASTNGYDGCLVDMMTIHIVVCAYSSEISVQREHRIAFVDFDYLMSTLTTLMLARSAS